MTLRATLFLTIAFLAAAVAFIFLPACGDDNEPGVVGLNCEAFCDNDCFRITLSKGCTCIDLVDGVCPL